MSSVHLGVGMFDLLEEVLDARLVVVHVGLGVKSVNQRTTENILMDQRGGDDDKTEIRVKYVETEQMQRALGTRVAWE